MMERQRYIEPEKRLKIRDEADVLVAGGGTAGCIAAIAAAREGAKVILVERMPIPGGQFAAGGLIANSLYASTDDNAHPLRLVEGLAGELLNRMIAEGTSPGFIPTRVGNHYRRPYILSVDHEAFHATISQMMQEAGVKVYLQTAVTDVIKDEEGRLSGVIVESCAGREVITARQFVDATGDGDLARFAGCPQQEIWDKYGVNQLGLVFGMNGVDFERLCEAGLREGFLDVPDSVYAENGKPLNGYIRMILRFRGHPRYQKLVEAGIGGFLCVSVHPGQLSYSNSVNIKALDVMQTAVLSDAEMDLRVRIIEVCKLMRENVPGFENAYVHWSSDQLGVRVTRITLCEKIVTNEELCAGTRYEDEIGLYGYHDLLPIAPECAIRGEGYFGLPYRMIVPLNATNLLMAGRTFTNEFKAHMITRNTMCCMMTGQAAGVAAALCCRRGEQPRTLPYAALRDGLLRQHVKLSVESGAQA